VIMGPTILGRFIGSYMMKLFPLSGKMVLQTAANIGFLLHLFVLGVHMDTRILRKAGGAAVLIGTIGFVMPYALAGLTYFIMNHAMPVDESITTSLPFIVAVNSMSSFPVITTLLADLHILNSEIGRLATYASMVSDLCFHDYNRLSHTQIEMDVVMGSFVDHRLFDRHRICFPAVHIMVNQTHTRRTAHEGNSLCYHSSDSSGLRGVRRSYRAACCVWAFFDGYCFARRAAAGIEFSR